MLFRVTRILGSFFFIGTEQSENGVDNGSRPIGGSIGELLFDVGQKGSVPRMLMTFTWRLAIPFFMLWTLLGTSWLWQVAMETPNCVQTSTYFWFSGCWLALCYYWVFIHAALCFRAWKMKRRVQRAEANLRIVEDADVQQRWGRQVTRLQGRSYAEAAALSNDGLSPAEIKDLPLDTVILSDLDSQHRECSICLAEFEDGDPVRSLQGCGHVFHKSCIDLWLVRQPDCPLCKRHMKSD